MARKPCASCGVHERAPKLTKCVECWLAVQPAAKREAWADRRLASIPPGLRLTRVPAEQWPPGRRWCAGCQTFVRTTDVGKGGSRCKTCAGRAGHATMLKATYEILDPETGDRRPFTAEDYARLLREQDGRCWICRTLPGKKRLAVDHNHRTGLVRHLLCPGEWGCNLSIIGIIEKNRDPLGMARRVLTYIEESQ